MLVYRFLNHEYGLMAIKDQELRISRIMDLNDPFEFLSAELVDPVKRTGLRNFKKNFSEDYGLICFSENWSNPLLWGHYADKHKGVCLGFEIPPDHLNKINYVNERFTFSLENHLKNGEELIQKILFNKFNHWSYEEEYRLHTDLKEEDGDGNYFQQFSENLILKKVIVGCESKITREELVKTLGGLVSQVELFRVRPSFLKFEVERNKNESLWV